MLGELLNEEPVVVLTGARTVGKSTLLAACAAHHGVTVLDLDELETRRAVTADPALFVAADRPTPVCIGLSERGRSQGIGNRDEQ